MKEQAASPPAAAASLRRAPVPRKQKVRRESGARGADGDNQRSECAEKCA